MIAADIILNNPDRAPAIWPNQGNDSNIMMEARVSLKYPNEGSTPNDVFFNSRATASISVVNVVAVDNNTIPI